MPCQVLLITCIAVVKPAINEEVVVFGSRGQTDVAVAHIEQSEEVHLNVMPGQVVPH